MTNCMIIGTNNYWSFLPLAFLLTSIEIPHCIGKVKITNQPLNILKTLMPI